MPAHRSVVSLATLFLAASAPACGARTGLPGPPDDSGTQPTDAATDTLVADTPLPDTTVEDVPTLPDVASDTIILPDVPPDAPSVLKISPPNDLIVIDLGVTPAKAQHVDYSAIDSSTGADVTKLTTFSVDSPIVGSFTANRFTAVTALPATIEVTNVRGTDPTGSGSTTLTLAQLRRTPDPLGHHDFLYNYPFGTTPTTTDDDMLVFSATVGQMDVAFLQDTTGSMSGEMSNLKSTLSTSIIPGLAGRIKSLGFGVAYHDDFPYGSYGSPGIDLPVHVLQTITTDPTAAEIAVSSLNLHSGGDTPEAQIPAQYHLLTGSGLVWPTGNVAPHLPPSGATWFGAMEFRKGGTPVVVEITDASWHDTDNPPCATAGGLPGCGYDFKAPGMTDLIGAYRAVGGKFVGVLIDLGTGDSPWAQARTLSDATNSNVPPSAFGGKCGTGMCCTGLDGAAVTPDGPGGTCRLNFAARSDGTGVGDGILNGLSAIVASGEGTYDARVLLSNDPANPPGVDATKFITEVRAVDAGDAAHGCIANPAVKSVATLPFPDTFQNVPSGKKVCWKIVPAVNNFVKPIGRPQVFAVHLRVSQEPGDVFFGDERVVLFVVPPA